MANSKPKESLRVLLSEIVDYAGLFPPAQLSMRDAADNYAKYKRGEYNSMLGRFIVPVARLEEFVDAAKNLFSSGADVWKLSVLASEDIDETIAKIEDFNERFAGFAVCDALHSPRFHSFESQMLWSHQAQLVWKLKRRAELYLRVFVSTVNRRQDSSQTKRTR